MQENKEIIKIEKDIKELKAAIKKADIAISAIRQLLNKVNKNERGL